MSTIRTGRLWPPLPLLLGFVFLAIIFGEYRACQQTTTAVFTEHLTPRLPESGGSGAAGIATLALKDAPRHVQRVVHHLRSIRHWRPLRGYKGGRAFRNLEGQLPAGRRYFEYDVHALRPGVSRGAERLVVDESKTLFYYTRDHYSTFRQIRLPE
jgi:guanyl-specific ribonuclease Sa